MLHAIWIALVVSISPHAAALTGAADPAPHRPEPIAEKVPLQRVSITTSHGEITLELDPNRAPESVDNFLRYAMSGHYDNTVFHRVIGGFVIQGGGLDAAMNAKPVKAPIPLESNNGLSNLRGTIAVARSQAPHSGTAQFYINVADNPQLDFVSVDSDYARGFAVFGKVVSGMRVVDRISRHATAPKEGLIDVPIEPIFIREVRVLPR